MRMNLYIHLAGLKEKWQHLKDMGAIEEDSEFFHTDKDIWIADYPTKYDIL